MKINKSTNRRKYIITSIIVSALLLGIGIYAFISLNRGYDQSIDGENREDTVTSDNGMTPNDQKADLPVKQDDIDDPNQPKQTAGASIDIVSYNQSEGDITLISKASSTSTDGTCTFSFSTDSAKPIVRSVIAKNGTCTVVIPEVEFEKIGVWQVKTNYNKNNVTLAESSDAITVN